MCGVNPASGLYTALVRYDPARPAGAITIQVQGFRGPGTYVNTTGATPVDVEVSPPAPDLTGLSGFGVDGATVVVAGDLRSGSLTSQLQSGSRVAGTISGSWRCG